MIKQRIARDGEGASGGFRSIILYKQGDRAFFVFGFPKARRANVKDAELKEFRKLAKIMLTMSDDQIEAAKKVKSLTEVSGNG